jgi:cyclase
MSSSRADHPELGPPEVQEVSDGIFAYVQPDGSWFINNTGFIKGDRTVLSIDTCSTEKRTRDYLATIEKTAGRAPTTLVNTHHHGDHTNGNWLLPYAAVIGHERCREEIVNSGILRPDGLFEPVEWGELHAAPPFVTFENRMRLYVDDLCVELIHLTSAAHTTNDIVAWIPERRVLFTGDLVFNGGTPFIVMGSVRGSLEALDAIAELDPAVVIPGHGAPGGIELLDTHGEYLRWLQSVAADARSAGISALDAARGADLGDFAALLDAERVVGNLHRAMAECAGIAPGEPIDLVRAFGDMLTFNGGKPLRCLA